MSPRVYVACLASYNNGILHGAWIDAAQDSDQIMEDIGAMLGSSPMPDAEEWAVHDTEGLPDLGEWPDLDQLAQVAQGIEEHGDAYRAYLECFDADTTSREDFQGRYLGEYRDREDFAADWLEQTGGLANVPEHLQAYIDFDAYGRDLVVGGAVTEHDGHWFYND
jgi:antirestriction protein